MLIKIEVYTHVRKLCRVAYLMHDVRSVAIYDNTLVYCSGLADLDPHNLRFMRIYFI